MYICVHMSLWVLASTTPGTFYYKGKRLADNLRVFCTDESIQYAFKYWNDEIATDDLFRYDYYTVDCSQYEDHIADPDSVV